MQKTYKYRYIPTIIFFSIFIILPVLVRFRVSTLSGNLLLFFVAPNGISTDLVLYYKASFFILLTVLLCAFFLGERIFPDKPLISSFYKHEQQRVFLLLAAIYIFLVFLSFLFSKYKSVAWYGAPNSYEGTFVQICYLLIFIFAINYFNEEHNIRVLLKAIPFLLCFFVLFGFVEYFYKSPLATPLFEFLELPQAMWNQIGKLGIRQYHGHISLTLANPDYVGMFLVLFLPFTILNIRKNAGVKKILFCILSALLVVLLFFSGSTAAFYAFFAELLILLIIYRKSLMKDWQSVLMFLGVTASFLVLMGLICGNGFLSALFGDFQNSSAHSKSPRFSVDTIRLDHNRIYLIHSKTTLVVQDDAGKFTFYDTNGKQITANNQSGKYTFEQSEYAPVVINDKGKTFEINLGYYDPIIFTLQSDQVYAVGANGTFIKKTDDSSGFGFENFQSFATGRGYIWRKSLPLLSQTLIVGFGADCTAFYIPNNDYAGKLNFQGTTQSIIDKPHDMYLQTALNFGIPAVLVLLTLFVIFIIRAIKFFLKNGNGAYPYYDTFAALFTGIIGYLLCCFFYDSSISVAPLFWCMLGMAVAVSNKLRESKSK